MISDLIEIEKRLEKEGYSTIESLLIILINEIKEVKEVARG